MNPAEFSAVRSDRKARSLLTVIPREDMAPIFSSNTLAPGDLIGVKLPSRSREPAPRRAVAYNERLAPVAIVLARLLLRSATLSRPTSSQRNASGLNKFHAPSSDAHATVPLPGTSFHMLIRRLGGGQLPVRKLPPSDQALQAGRRACRGDRRLMRRLR